MFKSGAYRTVLLGFLVLLGLSGMGLGAALGFTLATNRNNRLMDELRSSRPAIPSQIFDINGELITEFFSEENRELVSITDLPENLIHALLTREDSSFFKHRGFSLGGFSRAMINNFRHWINKSSYFSGGSTLSQQLATYLYLDKTDLSIKRKLKELWWTYQLEQRFTKYEILEQYMNSMYFGDNNYGVEAASRFLFGHSAKENSPAESVILVIQLASPALYSPIDHPEVAKKQQKNILSQMVDAGYLNAEKAELSFQAYWNNYDWSRGNYASAFYERDDKTPYFSEYIRSLLDQYLFGQQDIYRDGYSIYTTLDLDIQREAEKQIAIGLERWNKDYRNNRDSKNAYAERELAPLIDLLSLTFDIPQIRVEVSSRERRKAIEYYETQMPQIMDMMALTFGLDEIKTLAGVSYDRTRSHARENNIETALITLDNDTGYIMAMIGGSEFSRTNQFNRAMDGKLMPGSAFKPLFYSAAISSREFTAATRIHDGPAYFTSPDGTLYTPLNYKGNWRGHVLLRTALSKSLNVPAVKILDGIGFDMAIDRASALLGITDPEEIGRIFDRLYPLALGIVSISPAQLARSYATIANEGRAVEPLAIRYIEDRDGSIIVNPERDLRREQLKKSNQIMTPQEAYIMVSLLQSTVTEGTLRYASNLAGGFDDMPMAGKTGTTQNWTDAWTCGFSPHYTTVIWAGFDERGNSLGEYQTGATSTGPVWARYMKAIHKDLPRIEFPEPETGLVRVSISSRTGMLAAPDSDEPTRSEIFLTGTEPRSYGQISALEANRDEILLNKIIGDISLEPSLQIDREQNDRLFEELGIDPNIYDETGISSAAGHLSGSPDFLD